MTESKHQTLELIRCVLLHMSSQRRHHFPWLCLSVARSDGCYCGVACISLSVLSISCLPGGLVASVLYYCRRVDLCSSASHHSYNTTTYGLPTQRMSVEYAVDNSSLRSIVACCAAALASLQTTALQPTRNIGLGSCYQA
jgi:hypothetical protein